MGQLVLRSPAKLNLYLNVLRKRPDGYHDIETVFEKIALFDIITISPNKRGIRLTTDNPKLPTDRRNLAYKAIEVLFNKAGFLDGVWIDIKKNIPVRAGLGGGSSNAAITLLAANKFFKLGLNQKELIRLGEKLGADVPFFLYDANFAIGKGRGSEISPIWVDKNITIWHIIVSFNFGISTPQVYNALNLRLTHNLVDVKIPPRHKNNIENLAASLYNRLEEAVLDRFALIKTTKRLLLKEGAYGAVLSGSGPTVFGITRTREEAIRVGRRIAKKLSRQARIFVVSTFLHERSTDRWKSRKSGFF